jgi:Phosphorylated adapter RNA export protein, RNA-binding domain
MTPDAILAEDFPPKPFDVAFLAAVLGETDQKPLADLAQIATRFGPLATWRLLQKTLDVEARGGMPVPDGSRRRTPGGTFFVLARTWGRGQRGQPPFTYRWPPPSLGRTVAKLLESPPGGDCTMKTTLIGTPGPLEDRYTYVAFTMCGTAPPSLPKGLPPAPPEPLTWVVLVAKKQWAKVAASLEADPKTKVLIEGYPCLQGPTHVLLALQCTTTALQRAKAPGKVGTGA